VCRASCSRASRPAAALSRASTGDDPSSGSGARPGFEVMDGLLPEPLDDVLEREAQQRVRVAELIDGLDE
jgi:hypothetical protein